ncbi:MAG: hypothetical protein WKF79_12540 [Nocardioides sp.]
MNRVQSLLGVEVPIIWAPMTHIARAEVPAAAADTGGMGVIETLTEEGRSDLVRVRDLTNRPGRRQHPGAGLDARPSIVDTVATADIRRPGADGQMRSLDNRRVDPSVHHP